jgi:23S rRNA (uracil1939-C5)-methyltransferase
MMDIRLLRRTTIETVVLLSNNFSKAKDYVEIGIDAEDYFRIKNSGKESK